MKHTECHQPILFMPWISWEATKGANYAEQYHFKDMENLRQSLTRLAAHRTHNENAGSFIDGPVCLAISDFTASFIFL